MRKRWAAMTIAVVLCLAVGGSFSVTAQEEEAQAPAIAVSGLAHKLISGPDADDDYEISLKVTVKNSTASPRRVMVWVQALDREGFEVFDAELKGTVGPGETRILTDTRYIAAKTYASVVEWRIED